MATRLNARLGLSVGTTPTNVIDANGSITANSLAVANTFAVGANVNANTTGLYIGNSTVNSTHTSTLLQVSNSTFTTNVSANGIYVGGTYVNSSAVVSTYFVYAAAGLDSQVQIGDATNGSIEIGKQGRTVAGTPYIDFHSSAGSPDHDARIIASGGNTTTGSGNLQIAANVLNLPNTVVTGTANATVAFNVGANVYANTTALFVGNSTVNAVITSSTVQVANATGTTLFVAANGNIGIGNNTPSKKFQVDGTSWFKPTADGSNAVAMYLGRMSDTDQPAFSVYTDDATSDSLTHKSERFNGYFEWKRNSASGEMRVASLQGVNSSRTEFSIYHNEADNTAKVRLSTGTDSYINGAANVGIGTSAPDAKFHVVGTANISGNLWVGGATTIGNTIATGNATHTGFLNVSSTANIGGAITARSDVTVNGQLIVANTASLGNTTITGWANVTTNLQATNVRTTGDVQIDGNLIVNGNTVTVAVTNLNLADNMIYLNEAETVTITSATSNGTAFIYTANNGYAAGMVVTTTGISPAGYNVTANAIVFANATHFTVANTSAPGAYVSGGTASAKSDINPDLGFAGGYNDGTYRHAGFFRDATDGVFKVFDQYVPEPSGAFIDTSNNTFRIADFQANNTTLGNLTQVGQANIGGTVGAPAVVVANGTYTSYLQLRGSSTSNPGIKVVGSGTTNLDLSSEGAATVRIYTNAYAQQQFAVAHTSSAVNYLQATGAVADGVVALTAQGASANVGINIAAKGTAQLYLAAGTTGGAVRISTLGAEQVTVGGPASAVNRITLKGGITGISPQLAVQGSDTNVGFDYSTQGTGSHSFYTNDLNAGTGQLQFRVTHVANTVNYVNINGNATLNAPIIQAAGSDTNIDLIVRAKGTWSTYVGSTQGTGAVFNSAASGVNYFQLRGSATGAGPQFSSLGNDTNIDMNYVTKGTGSHVFNSGTGTEFKVYTFGGTTVNYWSAVGGATGTAPYLYAQGSDANVDGKIATKGTGQLRLYTNGGNDEQFRITHTANAVNFIQATGANTGNSPTMLFTGTDANVSAVISTKGTGGLSFYSNGVAQRQLRVTHTASAVNFLDITGGATGAAPSIVAAAASADADVGITIAGKGAGTIGLSSNTVIGANSLVVDTVLNRVGVGRGLGSLPTAFSVTTTYDGDGIRIGPGTAGWGTALLFANSTSAVSQIAGINTAGNFSTVSNIGDVLVIPGNHFQVANSTVSRFIVAANGNVGVGNTTPADKLVINGNTTITSGSLRVSTGSIFLDDVNNTGTVLLQKAAGNTSQAHRLEISNLGGNSTVSASQWWNGLHFTPPTGFANSTSGTQYPRTAAFFSYTSNTNPSDLYFNLWNGNNGGTGGIDVGMKLYAISGTDGLQRGIDIAANGNIGIGNTTPVDKFVVQTSSNTQVILSRLHNIDLGTGAVAIQRIAAGVDKSLTLYASGGGYSGMYGNANAPTHYSDFDTHNYRKIDGTTKVVFAANGNVGIANSTPDATLAVNGTANITANVWIGGSATIAGNLTVSGTTTYINTTTLNIGDNIITLNADLGAVAPSENAGIEVNRGTSSNSSLYWDETNDRWVATNGSDSNAAFAVVSNSYMRTAYVTSASVVDQWGTLAQPGSFAEFVVASGVNKLDNKNRDYYIANSSVNNAIFAANGNVGIGNTTPGSKLVVQGGGADANTTAGIVADFYGAVVRIGDSSVAQTFTNGIGFKIADSGTAHYSIGQIGGKLTISDTSANDNQLYPATRTDIITANSTNVTINAPVVFNGYVTLPGGGGAINAINLTTSTTTANQVLHSTGAANWRVIKYLIQVTSGSAYHTTEITLMHDGTNVYKTEYGQMFTGTALATFDADINSGNIRLLVTPVNAVTTIKATLTTVSV